MTSATKTGRALRAPVKSVDWLYDKSKGRKRPLKVMCSDGSRTYVPRLRRASFVDFAGVLLEAVDVAQADDSGCWGCSRVFERPRRWDFCHLDCFDEWAVNVGLADLRVVRDAMSRRARGCLGMGGRR